MSKFIRKKRNSESWFRYFSSVSHLWLGLLSSIVIFTTSFSGSIYAFKTQIENVINNASIYNTNVTNTSKSNLDNMMDAFENRYSKATSITLFKDSTRSVLISSATRNIDGTSAYYDAVTHKNLGNKNETSIAFFKIVLDVHRNILMGDFGKKINGTAVLIFIFLLFSGFVIWLPKKISQLKNNLSIKWNARFFRLNFDLHRLLGLYSLLLLFIISSTGVYVSFHWIKNVFIIGLGGESIVLSEDNLEMKKNISKSFTVLLNQLQNDQNKINTKKTTIEYIKNLTDSILPYSGQTTFILPNELSNFYTIEKLNNNNWGGMYFPDRISFTPAGNIATIELFSKLKLYEKFKCIAKPLHTGEIVGLPGIIIYFIASMIGCSLPITGFIIWWKKKKY